MSRTSFVPDTEFVARLSGSSLVTARIFYCLPDYRHLLGEFIWQQLDIVPRYPSLTKFLDFWDRELEGPIHKVEIAHVGLLTPAEIRGLNTEFLIN